MKSAVTRSTLFCASVPVTAALLGALMMAQSSKGRTPPSGGKVRVTHSHPAMRLTLASTPFRLSHPCDLRRPVLTIFLRAQNIGDAPSSKTSINVVDSFCTTRLRSAASPAPRLQLVSLCSAMPANARVQTDSWPKYKKFPIYDNMFYKGKPNTTRAGLIVSNILYEGRIWPDKKNYGVLPKREEFQSLVRKSIANPGPLVIDIEGLPLKGSAARHNEEVLATLADWAREAAPGKVIGYYGTNTLSNVPPANLPLAKELARHVEAFFPPMYTFDDDAPAWEKRAEETAAEARSLDSHKPVYFYLWPQYHDGTPKAFQYVTADYWITQLIISHRMVDGVVLWSPSKFPWDDHTHWWDQTVEYARNIKPIPDPIP